MKTISELQVSPSKIMQVGMGFFSSKTLLTAVNMELFTVLAKRELSAKEIQSRLGLHSRSLYDFLDALVALGFLKRRGLKAAAIYSNSEDAEQFLDKNKPSYIGGILEMANNRLYPFWKDLEEGLKTGQPQNETKKGGKSIFENVYSNTDSLREFVNGMAGVQMGNFMAFAQKFDFNGFKVLCDVGGAGGQLSIQVAMHNPHMKCISYDLPAVKPVTQEHIENMELEERVEAREGDFFTDDLPSADIITMGNILHDWSKKEKKLLISKAYQALPKGGALVIIENIIDDQRKENTFGLLMSLNMLIETEAGYDFTQADFDELATAIGFENSKKMQLTGPTSALIAIK